MSVCCSCQWHSTSVSVTAAACMCRQLHPQSARPRRARRWGGGYVRGRSPSGLNPHSGPANRVCTYIAHATPGGAEAAQSWNALSGWGRLACVWRGRADATGEGAVHCSQLRHSGQQRQQVTSARRATLCLHTLLVVRQAAAAHRCHHNPRVKCHPLYLQRASPAGATCAAPPAVQLPAPGTQPGGGLYRWGGAAPETHVRAHCRRRRAKLPAEACVASPWTAPPPRTGVQHHQLQAR